MNGYNNTPENRNVWPVSSCVAKTPQKPSRKRKCPMDNEIMPILNTPKRLDCITLKKPRRLATIMEENEEVEMCEPRVANLAAEPPDPKCDDAPQSSKEVTTQPLLPLPDVIRSSLPKVLDITDQCPEK